MINKYNVGDKVYPMPPANDDRPFGWTSEKEREIGTDMTVRSWTRSGNGYMYTMEESAELYAEEELKPARQW